MHLPLSTFTTVIQSTPLVSIDLIVQNHEGKVLLGYRNNRPAKGFWFVPGGRILKDESMASAFKRLTSKELGAEFDISKAKFIGPFEHFYSDNVTEEHFSTHYIALGYRLLVDETQLHLPLDQHSQYTWMTIGELLVHTNVHKHSRWYFCSSELGSSTN